MAQDRAGTLSLWDRFVAPTLIRPAQPRPEYVIRRSPRTRRVRLQIEEGGQTVVTMPLGVPERAAAELFERHRQWIERQLLKFEERRIKLAMRPSLAAGRVLRVNGEARVVRVANDAQREALEKKLRREARSVLAVRIATRAKEMGVKPMRLAVRDQKTRWGSASKDGAMSFSWRLILCPPDILDYVVVHELAHLRWGGHGVRFWYLVEKHYVDHRAARKWLRDHNDEIREALD